MNKSIPVHYLLIAKKIIGLTLIAHAFYLLFVSLADIQQVLKVSVYVARPDLSRSFYLSLLKKTTLISTGLLFDSFYGFILLIKPVANTRLIHLVFGLLLFLGSLFLFQLHAFDQILQQLPFLPLS